MAITKILNIQESEDRNPASHLKNALEYIQNPDKTGKRQGYNVIISFSPEEK